MCKVLLVDDHPIIVAAYRWLLEQDGATTVFDANDVLTGYQAFLQHEPDFIVIDLGCKARTWVILLWSSVSAHTLLTRPFSRSACILTQL